MYTMSVPALPTEAIVYDLNLVYGYIYVNSNIAATTL